MKNKVIETENTNPQNTGGGWPGIIFNLCFMVYYYLLYKLMIDETTFVQSYGLSSAILFSKTLALIVLISLLAEPFAIFYKIGYENYSVQGRPLKLPVIFLFIMVVSRFFVRLVFFIALLESLGVELENGGTGAAVIATLIIVGELIFVFAITDKSFVGKVKPAISREIFARFILLNILVFFTFLFKTHFADLVKGDDKTMTWKIIIGLILFITIYLPNTMVHFYGDWRASKTVLQKCFYIVSLGVSFLCIILF